ncbi:hypothetical protein CAEBREN_06534 [Caenorhabditis brenneri]|uniref:Uncharacterized protein n=1 Tax=Caenorhabditis brenneri TaxID=135651 RepID=G0NT38_CAEBE|nr:hypothetical protein CAEBREN_06534 [Caenorhabditis brenneri]
MASQFANQRKLNTLQYSDSIEPFSDMNTAKQCRNHGYSTEALQQEEALSTLESTD